jgi:hypothetical protein
LLTTKHIAQLLQLGAVVRTLSQDHLTTISTFFGLDRGGR